MSPASRSGSIVPMAISALPKAKMSIGIEIIPIPPPNPLLAMPMMITPPAASSQLSIGSGWSANGNMSLWAVWLVWLLL